MALSSSELKKAGLKVTLPRIKILEILENSDQHHMSAEDIYRALMQTDAEVGLATIYRVLTQFESAGLVIRHHFDSGQAIFELDVGDNHNHIVCLKSGRVEEFTDNAIEERLKNIAQEHGFEMNDYKLTIYGIHDKA